MKKTIIVTTMLVFSQLFSFGQLIPNGEFENWTSVVGLEGWGFAGNSGQSNEVELNDGQGGTTYLKPFGGDYFLYLQNSTTMSGQAQSFFPMTERPTTFEGAFASYPIGDDVYAVFLTFTKWNNSNQKRDTIMNMIILGAFQGNHPWKLRQVDLTDAYVSSATPDSCFLNIFAGVEIINGTQLTAGHPGSVLAVDNIKLNNHKVSVNAISNQLFEVNVYPNPAVNKVTITYGLKSESNVTVTVTDISGKTVSVTNEGIQIAGQHKVELDVSTLKPGIYFCTVNTGNAVETKKIIISR